jgi:transposase InsO family protein
VEFFNHQHNKITGIKGFVRLYNDAIRYRYMITPIALRRMEILAFWERHGIAATKDAHHVSRRTLFRWKQSLHNGRGMLEALNKRATAPQHRRRRTIAPEISTTIIMLRKEHPRLGKDKLRVLLRQQGYLLSASTVGRILTDLQQQRRLPTGKRMSLNARTGRMMARLYRPRPKLRRPHGYRVLEVDTVVRFIDGMKRYIVTGIDTERRTAFAAIYTNHGSASAADFLRKARIALPDCPSDVQTDNGSEFALHFATAVHELGLQFHTHPRSPKENAHIERFNRTLDEEFLRWHRAVLRDDVAAANDALIDWLLWYNGERPHYALGQQSPFRYMMSLLPTKECQMWWTHTFLYKSTNFDLYLPRKKKVFERFINSCGGSSAWLEHSPVTRDVVGSNPIHRANERSWTSARNCKASCP